ncbi:MAG: hypothetical protein NZ772_03420 [Cyanobacteria bacterium]|nr:hypothetical protein [Cyanobacteriota bacterium]MDW8200373.1 hypothetical protein [Cyanobacteriota bacterium SKYGB_h_bin112]
MLHLAKVLGQKSSGSAELQLLAYQQPDTTWHVIGQVKSEALSIEMPSEKVSYGEGTLVVIELSDDNKVRSIQDATDWILDMLAMPTFLQQEIERLEAWRQSLTLESQELARRNLEVEARLEHIQALEESLRKERKSQQV